MVWLLPRAVAAAKAVDVAVAAVHVALAGVRGAAAAAASSLLLLPVIFISNATSSTVGNFFKVLKLPTPILQVFFQLCCIFTRNYLMAF